MPIIHRNTRSISWIKAARKEFETFPNAGKEDLLDALSVVAEGKMLRACRQLKQGHDAGQKAFAVGTSAAAMLGIARREVTPRKRFLTAPVV